MEHWLNDSHKGKLGVLGETLFPISIFPAQNPTCDDVELNPGFSGDRPANNRLSHGTTNTEDTADTEFSQWF
jgi:hypothetical protein